MKYSNTQNWMKSLDLVIKRPIILMPFIIYAFLQAVTLDILYFSSRRPLSVIIAPIIRKFWGASFSHYPGNLLLLPNIFDYIEVLTYIAADVFLVAVTVSIFKGIKANASLKLNTTVKGVSGRYGTYFMYGLLMAAFVFISRKISLKIFLKVLKLFSFIMPGLAVKTAPFTIPVFLFMIGTVIQVFCVMAIPMMVLQKKSLLKSIKDGVVFGWRNFSVIFTLIFLPYLIYLPVVLLRSNLIKLSKLTFPEINFWIIMAGIVIGAFIDYFVIICASQFLLDREPEGAKAQ